MIHKRNKIISIVEDSEEIGSSLKTYLNGHTPYCCDRHYLNGNIAIEGILSCKPELVIMDIGLPDMTGLECMSRIKKTNQNILFLIFTVFDSTDILFKALADGADGYILKDYSNEMIAHAIKECLHGGGPMSPEIARKVISSFNKSIVNSKLVTLTAHQSKILGMVADGYLNKEIADRLSIKEGTVKVQISSIYKKLQVNNRVEASMLYRGF